MKLRPQHAEPLRRSIARRVNDWLDQKVNRPLKPNTIRIRTTEEIGFKSMLFIGPTHTAGSAGLSFETTMTNVSPDFMRLMYGGPIKVVPRRPFDWKLDAPEVLV